VHQKDFYYSDHLVNKINKKISLIHILLTFRIGTGKTLFAKCIANESKARFFNISASVLTSKWQGESEKLVKVLYEVAKAYQPSVIFVDEIDSLLSKRSEEDRESSRRIKTEFFIQMDGCKSEDANQANDRILVNIFFSLI